MARRPCRSQVPPRNIRLKICVAAECGEQAVARYFSEPDRVRPAIRSAIRRVLPVLGLSDPHAGAAL